MWDEYRDHSSACFLVQKSKTAYVICVCFFFLPPKAALGNLLRCTCSHCGCLNANELNSIRVLQLSYVPEIKDCLLLSHIYLFLRLFLAPAGQLVPTSNGYFSTSELYICLITLIRHIKTLGNGCVYPICECQSHITWCRHFPSCCTAVWGRCLQ